MQSALLYSSRSLTNPETKLAARARALAAAPCTGLGLKRCFVMTTDDDPCLQSTSSVDRRVLSKNFNFREISVSSKLISVLQFI